MSNNLQLFFTGVVALATLVYAYLTYVLVKETIRLRQIQTEPEIIVYLQPIEDSPSFLEIIVRNIGGGTAYNLKWSFDLEAKLIKEKNTRLDKQKFFIEGMDYFAPGQIYRSIFGVTTELYEKPIPSALLLKVSYENMQTKKYQREFSIDPDQFSGRSWLLDQGLTSIRDKLKIIANSIENIGDSSNRLNIDIYNSTDRNRELKEFEKQLVESKNMKNRSSKPGVN